MSDVETQKRMFNSTENPIGKEAYRAVKLVKCKNFSLKLEQGSYLSHVMRKPVYAVYEQQDTDQPAQSDQHLCCSLHR